MLTSSFEDKEPTKPKRDEKLFDVVLLDVPPANRMRVIDTMMANNLYPHLSLMDAMIMIFRLPSVVMHCCELKEAVILEMIFEMHGATVQVRSARYCGDVRNFEKPDDGDTKQLHDPGDADFPDKKSK